MPRFDRALIREIADSASMVELVRRHVPLVRAGTSWKGRCPFHDEKTPSFHVNEARKSYHCFGCGAHGDAVRWLMEMEGLPFVEALGSLADQAGIRLPQEELSHDEKRELDFREQLLRANDLACRYFQDQLQGPGGAPGRAELDRRGVPPELRERYKLGFAPDAWDGLATALRRAGVPGAVAEQAGLLVPREGGTWYDRFRNRVIFPIHDPSGKVVAFGGRTLGDDPAKYINSPESPVYRKGRTLYGMHEARRAVHKEDRVLVVEGYFDVLGLARAGLEHAVAPCGTALTEAQIDVIRRHTQRVVLFFDNDAAGRKAAFRALPLCLKAGLWPLAPTLPDGKDPDEFVRAHGAEALRAVADEAAPLLDQFLDGSLAEIRPDAWSREQALAQLLPTLALLPRGQADPYLQRVALALALDPGGVRQRAKSAAAPARPTEARAEERSERSVLGPPVRDADPFGGPRAAPSEAEKKLVRLLAQVPQELVPHLDATSALHWVDHPEVSAIAGRLVRCYREGLEPMPMEILDGVEDAALRAALTADLTSDHEHFSKEVATAAQRECLIRLHLDWLERRLRTLALELNVLQSRRAPFEDIRPVLEQRQELERSRQEWSQALREQR